MPYATRGDQTLRATARNFGYYLLRDQRDPVLEFLDFGDGSIPTDRSYFSSCAAGSDIACVGSISIWEGILLTCRLLLFVTATLLLGMYFLPVAVVLSGGVKQVTTLPWH